MFRSGLDGGMPIIQSCARAGGARGKIIVKTNRENSEAKDGDGGECGNF